MKEYEQIWLSELNALIEEELGNPEFTLTDLVELMDMSPAQFYRELVKLTGLSPNHYIRLKRLNQAKDLLERGTYRTVKNVGLAVGYRHTSYFSMVYEKQFGKRPSEYLR